MERGEVGEQGEGSRQRDETPKSNRKSRNKMNKAPNTFGAIDNLKIQEALEVGRDEDQARERERD